MVDGCQTQLTAYPVQPTEESIIFDVNLPHKCTKFCVVFVPKTRCFVTAFNSSSPDKSRSYNQRKHLKHRREFNNTLDRGLFVNHEHRRRVLKDKSPISRPRGSKDGYK